VAGIYVHLPFCPYICPYCDFAKWRFTGPIAQSYLAALHQEIAAEAGWNADTIFLGGGTPNTYGRAEIATLVQALRERFGATRETTVECNPELVTLADCLAYVEAGVLRISLGVQALVAEQIVTLGRKHTVEDVRRAVVAARTAGMQSVSLDLMFGVPGQSLESWTQTLTAAIELAPDHISVYGLTIEPGTPFFGWHERRPEEFLDDGAEADLYGAAMDILESAGYEQYEISNFARPGHRCLHNLNYWENGEYLGFGVGAASYRGGERWMRTRSLRAYLDAVNSGAPVPAERERLTGAARNGEAVMLALRTEQGVRFETFRARYGVDFLQFYAPIIGDFQQMGLLNVDDTHAWLSRRGRFLANDVCGAFVTFA